MFGSYAVSFSVIKSHALPSPSSPIFRTSLAAGRLKHDMQDDLLKIGSVTWDMFFKIIQHFGGTLQESEFKLQNYQQCDTQWIDLEGK